MATKVCTICNIEKDSSEFYSKRGKCKSCYGAISYRYQKEWRKAHPEEARERSRIYEGSPARKTAQRARVKRYRQTEAGKQMVAESNRRMRRKHGQKFAARRAVKEALREGRLIRPAACERCGGPSPEAHHPDYAQRLSVRWLCRECHTKEHRGG